MMNTWIKVEDRLPNDSDRVLAYQYGYHTVVMKYEKEYNCFNYDGSQYDMITHWMPLPDEPK